MCMMSANRTFGFLHTCGLMYSWLTCYLSAGSCAMLSFEIMAETDGASSALLQFYGAKKREIQWGFRRFIHYYVLA